MVGLTLTGQDAEHSAETTGYSMAAIVAKELNTKDTAYNEAATVDSVVDSNKRPRQSVPPTATTPAEDEESP